MVNQRTPIDICILIPCYNNPGGLIRSISSIVYHTGRFVVLVVDDGSTLPVNLDALYQHLPIAVKIKLIRLEQNQGITHALNRGLRFIEENYTAAFIARLDTGDICSPQRFFKQTVFFEENPGIDLVGSWCYFKNISTGESYKYITPTQHYSIKNSMYFRNVFIHPTVTWRTAALTGLRYPENYPHAEDYGLFYDIVTNRKTAIISDFLVTCEINPQGISFLNRFAQLKSRLRVIWNYGTDKWRIAAGTGKLLLLMALPYQLVYRVKTWLFKI